MDRWKESTEGTKNIPFFNKYGLNAYCVTRHSSSWNLERTHFYWLWVNDTVDFPGGSDVKGKLNHFPILCFARFWVSEGFCISRLRQWCPKALVQVSGFLHGSWDSLQKLKNDSSVDHFWGLFRSIENIIYLPWNKGNICFIWECPNCSHATSKISIFFFPRTAFKKGVYFLHCQEQSFHLWETWEL